VQANVYGCRKTVFLKDCFLKSGGQDQTTASIASPRINGEVSAFFVAMKPEDGFRGEISQCRAKKYI
jgi:hypothetical protein